MEGESVGQEETLQAGKTVVTTLEELQAVSLKQADLDCPEYKLAGEACCDQCCDEYTCRD